MRVGMSVILIAMLTGCGGSDGTTSGGSSIGATGVTPTPAPTATPTAAPSPQIALAYLYTFGSKTPDGSQPVAPLRQASDGNFYGTTLAGGTNTCRGRDAFPCGTLYRITPSGQETLLYSFGTTATDAYTPGPLIQGKDGALYGVSANGGTYGGGTVFRYTLTGSYSILYSFGASSSDGNTPVGITQGSDGNFYGTTASGGANHCDNIPQAGGNCGTVFKLTPGGVETVLYSFGASISDGVEPTAPVVQGSDGNFYGTTVNGGANACTTSRETHNCGTVFRITPDGRETVLHSFGADAMLGLLGADGIAPQGPVIQGSDGAFYGTTASGGRGSCGSVYGCGTVYRITSGGALSIIYTFGLTSRTDGDGPSPTLLQGADGNFYGTTRSGSMFGACSSCGTAFRLTPGGVLTTLYYFGPVNQKPSDPLEGLTQGSDGAFYGVTAYGDGGGYGGTVFRLSGQ